MLFFLLIKKLRGKPLTDNSDPTNEVMLVDMIRYSLEHADKNIACKECTDWVDRSTFFVDGVKDKV